MNTSLQYLLSYLEEEFGNIPSVRVRLTPMAQQARSPDLEQREEEVNLPTRGVTVRTETREYFFPAVIFFLVHSAIGHKEIRFILPAIPAIFYVLAIALDGLEDLSDRILRPAFLFPPIIALAALSAYSTAHLELPFSSLNLAPLEISIRKDGGLKRNPQACLLFYDLYLQWTRGDLIQGQTINRIEVNEATLRPENLLSCAYALVVRGGASEFSRRAGQGWIALGEVPSAVLFRNRNLLGDGNPLPGGF